MKSFSVWVTALAAILSLLSVPEALSAATKKKDARASLSAEQKAQIRKRAREWCKKKYVGHGQGNVERVEILSDGRVRCWFRS